MNDHIHIGIIEPSHIIYEGLSNIILKAGKHYQLYRFEDLDEIEDSVICHKLNVVIVNPVFIQNKAKDFHNIKRKLGNISWLGFIYSYFDNDILSLLDSQIQINDTPDSITKKIKKITSRENNNNSAEEQLTDRETDVLKLLVKGQSNKEIADNLNISIHTVISHRKNITQKTGIKSQAGLTIYSINNNIISLDDFSQNLI